ncbi:RICIN domain-containing protein [Streptomyces eurocidicus]|uniref:Ricin B lectin domain-containing protein n=1 Tax=Streptomyces eurocidicus TaxID=66423 RepID=A0A7W8BIU5_STREU|nr:RICIN domain-containing protein [Streptomyces eurocidicus]MBB5122728.1 hypothetical protein [Streptomyces eurocidicus]
MDPMMSRTIRAVLALGVSVAVLVGGATIAQADQVTSGSATDGPSFVRLRPEFSGMCLTIDGGSMRDMAYAVQAACEDGLDNQLFELIPTGSATFDIRAKHSGRCIGNFGGPVAQTWCPRSDHWRVIMVEVINGLYEIRLTDSPDSCMTAPDAITNLAAYVKRCGSDVKNQRWRVESAAF